MTALFTLPPDRCFVTTLAEGLWHRVRGDPLQLAAIQIYLPTRRSCRHLREAFLRVTGAKAALLPRMQPLGDVDETDLEFAGASAFDDTPPAIAPLRRQMLLMKLIRAKDPGLPLEQAAGLAAALANLLDQAQTEGRDFADLVHLVPSELAQHWQETLRFLEIVTNAWPAVLQAEGSTDPVERRNKVLEAQAQAWRDTPPPYPVIAAGSTGSVPAVGRLMQIIAQLPQGEVILPGLDLSLDEEAWQKIDETHPQFAMKLWLERSGYARVQARAWEGVASVRPARLRLLQEAMRPAEVTDSWRRLTQGDIPAEAVEGLEKIELDHQREEADVIALRLRAVLEEPGRTAALVTPDRALAGRVAAALGRWGIEANDSAGAALDQWPVGRFLIDVLDAADPLASPVAYLAMLKHPLAAAGVEPVECRRRARLIEMKVWRGIRLADGWRGAAMALAERAPEEAQWLARIADLFAPLVGAWSIERPLADHMTAHIALAEALAATPGETGGQILWRAEAGEAAVTWLDDWRSAAVDLPPMTGAEYARLFQALIKAVAVRPAYGQHPRLSILGPLEARLMHHDVVVLGGLNEGTWPPAPAVDPWMSRPMKKAFGLPLPERRVGLSAHDFIGLASAGQVVLTRARRVGGTPTVPSRFCLQIEAVLKAAGHEGDDPNPALPWRSWARHLDVPDAASPMERPCPCPPLGMRPTKLSVTEIGTWLSNPYAIYAKHILALRKLEDIDAEVTAADHGTVVHEALENFLRQTANIWPDDPLALLLDEGRKAFAPFAGTPQVAAFWWPRFERLARWFVREEEKRRAAGYLPLLVEGRGFGTFRRESFTLSGRADRIDRLPDGRLEIIDYKTGRVPSSKQVYAGFEPQLPLLAVLAQKGGFGDVATTNAVGRLAYWEVKGGAEEAKITAIDENLPELIERAEAGLENLLELFARTDTPYEAVPKPSRAPRHDDYAHLARLAEWGRVLGEET